MSRAVLGFGDDWADGQDIRHALGAQYWSGKLCREISRAAAQRDFPALASLVRLSVLLRDRAREGRFGARPFLALVAALTRVRPCDDSLRPLFTGLLAAIPAARRSAECRAALAAACGAGDRAGAARARIAALPDPPEIADLAALRIARALYREPAPFPEARLRILRVDPAADCRVGALFAHLAPGDWRLLANRVDRLPDDAESWQCLARFARERMAPADVDALRAYVRSYWPRFHGARAGEPAVQRPRAEVLRALFPEGG
jgi:hypothetical protein